MWRSNFGIVMENDISSQDGFPEDISSPTPKLLALHHPLDDFTRIVAKQSRKRSSSSHVFTIPESTIFFFMIFFFSFLKGRSFLVRYNCRYNFFFHNRKKCFAVL
jgi:hypothetical protein